MDFLKELNDYYQAQFQALKADTTIEPAEKIAKSNQLLAELMQKLKDIKHEVFHKAQEISDKSDLEKAENILELINNI